MDEIKRIYWEMERIRNEAAESDNDTLKDTCFVPADQLKDWCDVLWDFYLEAIKKPEV